MNMQTASKHYREILNAGSDAVTGFAKNEDDFRKIRKAIETKLVDLFNGNPSEIRAFTKKMHPHFKCKRRDVETVSRAAAVCLINGAWLVFASF